jgi:hypothetical protein
MATRTIASPGVQINEIDLSLLAREVGGTNIFMTGFADQGPTDELINVNSISEFEDIFGQPTTAAERYFYHSARQVLTRSSGNLLVTRMPYGSGNGAGFSNSYSALVYPISSVYKDANGNRVDATYENSNEFVILPPKSILLSDDQYAQVLENNVSGGWGTQYQNSNIESYQDLHKAGLVIINSSKTAVNNLFEGYYIGLTDNSENNPASDFTSIKGLKAVQNIHSSGNYQTFTNVPSSRLGFSLTNSFSSNGDSISQVMEQFPQGYNFGDRYYNDSLTMILFKIRSTKYSQDAITLNYIPAEGYTGSLYFDKKQNSEFGFTKETFFLEDVTNNNSANIKMVINPNISKRGKWVEPDGSPSKTVRISEESKNLYSHGVYVANTVSESKDIGNVPLKLSRVLRTLDNLDVDLDLTVEAGLGTIWSGAVKKLTDEGKNPIYGPYIYDEIYPVTINELYTQTNDNVGGIASTYNSVFNQFLVFADQTRKDHIFLADPLKYIFIQGANSKTSKDTNFVFSSNIYWPLKNLYATSNSSYVAVYGNWVKVVDEYSNRQVWVPSSGFVSAIIAESSQINYPWTAPAGFNRGIMTNVLDIAITPTQKQRDLLYKVNINPITFFPGDGYVVFGQKTLFSKPSAFDRINVRRLFLVLEKITQNLLKYYVFEPNSYTTRTRLINSLTPIFDQAKNTDGLYDYKIVCDERNNPPNVIDNNELRVSIYIQPVRAAEFILADFIATRTGVDFSELIG